MLLNAENTRIGKDDGVGESLSGNVILNSRALTQQGSRLRNDFHLAPQPVERAANIKSYPSC